jgi:hypothetical protein
MVTTAFVVEPHFKSLTPHICSEDPQLPPPNSLSGGGFFLIPLTVLNNRVDWLTSPSGVLSKHPAQPQRHER